MIVRLHITEGTKPQNPKNGDYWLETRKGKQTLMKCSGTFMLKKGPWICWESIGEIKQP